MGLCAAGPLDATAGRLQQLPGCPGCPHMEHSGRCGNSMHGLGLCVPQQTLLHALCTALMHVRVLVAVDEDEDVG